MSDDDTNLNLPDGLDAVPVDYAPDFGGASPWQQLPHPNGVPQITIPLSQQAPAQQTNLGDQPTPKAGQTVQQPNVMQDISSMPGKVAGAAADVTGVSDAYKAATGQMTPEEAQMFALGALPALAAGPEEKIAQGVAEDVMPAAMKALGRSALPMDETSRMSRAAAQGFTMDAYHGTGSAEFDAFDPSKVQDNIQYGGNFYFTPDPAFADKHTGKWSGETPRVMPVKLNVQNPFRMDQPVTAEQAASVLAAAGRNDQAQKMLEGGPLKYWTGSTLFYFGLGQDTPAAAKAQAIRAAGYDAIIGDPQKEITGNPGRPHIMVFDPTQIRSRFDSFDPANVGSPRLIHNDVPPAPPPSPSSAPFTVPPTTSISLTSPR